MDKQLWLKKEYRDTIFGKNLATIKIKPQNQMKLLISRPIYLLII